MAASSYVNGAFSHDEGELYENKSQKEVYWDRFRVQPKSNGNLNAIQDRFFTWLRILAKITISGLCILIILISGVMSKLTTVLIISSIAKKYSNLSCSVGSTSTSLNISAQNLMTMRNDQEIVSWTWALILVICFPYAVVFIKNLWISLSCSRSEWTGCKVLLLQLLLETLHTTGVILFLTQAPADLEVFQTIALFLGLGVVPSLIKALNSEERERLRFLLIPANILSFIAQLSVVLVFPLANECKNYQQIGWFFSAVLMSLRWWPNFFNRKTLVRLKILKQEDSIEDSRSQHKKPHFRQYITQSNCYLQTIIYLWKIILTVFGIILSIFLRTNVPYGSFLQIQSLRSFHKDDFFSVQNPLLICVLNISSGLCCYYVVLHGIKSHLPAFAHCVPIMLLSPVTIATAFLLTKMFPVLKEFSLDVDTAELRLFWGVTTSAIVVWLASQMYICRHIWIKPVRKIEKTERIYFSAMYDGECIEQSLVYNRRPEKSKRKIDRRVSDDNNNQSAPNHFTNGRRNGNWRDPNVTQIYFCATMWHENKQEMLMLLKSVLRMDLDHFKKSSIKDISKIYNFETHIFFDDAYEDHKDNQPDYRVNDYVRQLVEAVPLAVREYFANINIEIKDPTKIATPYGGRLEWRLPSGNMMIAHLKDKAKIRHKKRWSQVMYMYYLLGEKLMNNEALNDHGKIIAAYNTYILALDGDVDFKPEAVHLLVDMMKKDSTVGAACGRIHPLGSGPIVWYQKFEYAIAHWLQKATEHVLGCVLCSPGCFSLFRAEALMSDNVMAKYATTSTKAAHYLQYDQGEDRWLCTLLMQAGYKVEYNAASDALTFAPEGFDEFFNQRRRWGPSTMANILDLILDCWNVIRINKHMSLLYVLYHGTQFFASIVGPGTIFLMITGALKLALEPIFGHKIWPAFFFNLIPVVAFTAVSFFVTSKTQLKMAKIYTIFYGLIMCMVMISVVIQIRSNWCSPSSAFFYLVTGSFVVSAILHPQECFSVVYGLVYFILIPCMYMLLIIYSFVNINNVSWGTREVVPTPSQQKENAEKQAEERERQKKGVLGFLSNIWSAGAGNDGGDDVDGKTFNCGSACRLVCCPTTNRDRRNEEYWQINKKLDYLLKKKSRTKSKSVTSTEDVDIDAVADKKNQEKHKAKNVNDLSEKASAEAEPPLREKTSLRRTSDVILRDDMVNPVWIEDDKLGSGTIGSLGDKEIGFWEAFIDKYLKPLDNNKANIEKVEQQLLELRQNVNFGFFLANATFIVVIMTLQANTDTLSMTWPCNSDSPQAGKANTAGTDVKVEPLGLMFLIYFMFILGLQFIGMIFHRLGTFWHILASTSIKDAQDDKAKLVEEIINLTMEGDVESDNEDNLSIISEGDGADSLPRNNVFKKKFRTTKKLLKPSATISRPVTSLQEAFQPNLEALATTEDDDLGRRFKKMSHKQRRRTIKKLKSVKSSRRGAESSRTFNAIDDEQV